MSVRLETLDDQDVPVKVALGPLPSGVEFGETTVEPDERHRVRP